MYIEAMNEENADQMLQYYSKLTEYVLKEAGGFHIDGWKLRSDLQLS